MRVTNPNGNRIDEQPYHLFYAFNWRFSARDYGSKYDVLRIIISGQHQTPDTLNDGIQRHPITSTYFI
ncbi:hypothetical protein D3C76_1815140 [compost metagenome]